VPTDDLPEPDELTVELRQVVRAGLRPSALKDLPKLFGLAVVGTEAHGSRPLDRAIALEGVIREAVAILGDGPTGQCVGLLLGMAPRSRGLLLKDRRDLAAEHLGISAEAFRKHWETTLLTELANELYKLEAERRIPIRLKGKKRSGPILDDLRSGTSRKSLDRREAEARLWSLMYALRADLLAVARVQQDHNVHDDWTAYAERALWLFARFADLMAGFTTDYGSALVMAGSEVTTQEAASLLGFKPPFDEGQVTKLRLVIAEVGADDQAAFAEGLTKRQGGEEMRAIWREWLYQGKPY